MAATEKRQMWFYKGPTPQIETRKIAATQGVYMPGSPCYVTSSGQVKLAVSGAGTTDSLYGVLLEGPAAELAENTEVKVAKFHPDQWWAMYAVTTATDTTLAQTNVGNKYAIRVETTPAGLIGYATVNKGDATNITVLMRDLMANVEPSKYSTSDSPAVGLVSVLQAAIQAVNS